LVGTLDYADGDEIRMLRTARMLKLANRDLKTAVQQQVRREGRTPRGIIAETALDAMERHLRQVLLGRVSLDQLREHLACAVDCSFDALEALEGANQNQYSNHTQYA